jgi:hypothetical protein
VFVKILETQVIDANIWMHTEAGLMLSTNNEGATCYVIADEAEAEKSWALETSKRKRMASAIASMLVRSHPLPKAKRFVRSILKHATAFYPEKPILKLRAQSIEDIMIELNGRMGLKKEQVFEYIKVGASCQSNPQTSVLDIAQEIDRLICMRPSTWVIDDLMVLNTEEIRMRNDRFIMSAAEGNLAVFREMLYSGKVELTSLHSELAYTALHAAADFGQADVVHEIVQSGLSLDIKDPRRGSTALHFAAQAGRIGVISALLDGGADRRVRERHG